jgi:hypothetical protein
MLSVLGCSAIAIVGAVRGDPVVVGIGGTGLLVVLANELFAKLGQTPVAAALGQWRRRPRAMQRDRWLAVLRKHELLVERVIAGADFHSWREFYDGDVRRRGKEITLEEFVDGEFCWRVIWFPTTEVVAWPYRWRDERWHLATSGGPGGRTSPSSMVNVPAPLPELIFLLGHSERAGAGIRRVGEDATLTEPRAALALLPGIAALSECSEGTA